MSLVSRPVTTVLMKPSARFLIYLHYIILAASERIDQWFVLYLQIKCGDLFENSVVDEFNECAVSRKKCVPRKSDLGEFPAPDPSVLVKSFNVKDFDGKWYITSGLNPTFDAFDCQLHEFHTEDGKLVGNISWRIKTPDSGFFTRSTVQKFVQDPNQPAVFYNHDNEYLHYQDDW